MPPPAVNNELVLVQSKLLALVKVASGGTMFWVTVTLSVSVQPLAAVTVTV